jgi:Glycosyl transferase family 2
VHDGEATLAAALASARSQTFADWELLVWDDASRDRSPAIAAAFAAADVRIRLERRPRHASLAEARQAAIAAARGEWLGFLDQDDLWLPDKLARQMALADAGVGLIYGRAVCFRADGRQHDFDHHHAHGPLPEGALFLELVRRSCFINMSAALVRRSALAAPGLLPPGVTVSPDYAMFIAVARHHAVRAVQAPVCLYRLHGDSMTQRQLATMQHDCVRVLAHWQADIPPALLAWRRRVHATVAAWADWRQGRTGSATALARVWRDGSLPWLLARPPARAWRALRARLQRPRWQQALPPGRQRLALPPEPAR